jgi:hypothetical protein
MSSQATLFSLAPANTLSILPAPAPSITPTRPGVSPVDQVRRAFAPQRRLSAALGKTNLHPHGQGSRLCPAY